MKQEWQEGMYTMGETLYRDTVQRSELQVRTGRD